jgi:hypothetical protein
VRGVLCAIVAAKFGIHNASARRGLLGCTAIRGLAVSMQVGVPLFLASTLIAGQWAESHRLARASILFLAADDFAHFVWGRCFGVGSLGAMGSNLVARVRSRSGRQGAL